MSDVQMPMVAPDDRTFSELRQVTVRSDDEIAAVNELLANGWQTIHIGQRADATVYVLGHLEEKPKHRAGFLSD